MTNASIFGDEVFSDQWIIVSDSNDCDVPVTLEDLLLEKPNDDNTYIKVCYYGQSWWLSKNLHFPM